MKTKVILLSCATMTVLGVGFAFWRSHHADERRPQAGGATLGQAASEPNVARKTNGIPPRLKAILENRHAAPPRTSFTNFTLEDETILLAAYKATNNLQDRFSITWTLAYIGGDATTAAFEHALTREFAGRTFNREGAAFDEANLLHDTVFALGMLATRNDKAFELLQNGIEPVFWQKAVLWRSDYGTDNYGILAGRSIEALGISARSGVPGLLEKLKDARLTNDTEPGPYRRTLNGAVLSAAFYYWLIQTEGREGFYRNFFADTDVFDHDGMYRRWKETEEGKSWKAWSEEFSKKAVAEMMEREKALKQ